MKQVLFILGLILLFPIIIQAQNKAESLPQDSTLTKPQISFVNYAYNFGKIRKGEKIVTSFYFKNTGTRPLTILQVQTSCGCTVSNWTKGTIAPKATGEITVTFDSAAKEDLLGMQSKFLLVISNAINKEVKLTLEGEVVNGNVGN